jgi:hypothetical protein
VKELIVVACHGGAWIQQCNESLAEHAADADAVFIDTGRDLSHGADVGIDGGYSTGAYLWAVEQYAAYDRFLFMQDSMTALADPLPWFRDLWRGSGAACWALFPMQWDNAGQAAEVSSAYPLAAPRHGIFGPVFYTDRASLDVLANGGLLPKIPQSRLDAQTAERSWAYAFATAGMPVTGPEWNPAQMQVGLGPFKKTWAARP